jgi:hypothetical protein
MNQNLHRTVVVWIGRRRKTESFRSPEEVPANWRRRLVRAINGPGAVSILIADQGGREQLARAFQGLPTAVRTRLLERASGLRRRRRVNVEWRLLAEIAALGAAALALWIAFAAR